MTALIVTPADEQEIKLINSGLTDKKIEPVELIDGRKVLNADLLDDLSYWVEYEEVLRSLELTDITLNQIKKPNESI
jgi:hypothetical protein